MARRKLKDRSRFTPLSRWIDDYCRNDIVVSNLDFLVHDYTKKQIMMIEEKQFNGDMGVGQRLLFQVLDKLLAESTSLQGYSYVGFYLLRMPGESPGPGMRLNGEVISSEQLKKHIDFESIFCAGYFSKKEDLFS